MKRQKYSNGGLNIKKDFAGVGSIEGNVSGNQNYKSGSLTASTKIGGARVSANVFKDSEGRTSKGISARKDFKNSSVSGYTNTGGSGARYSRKVGKGFNLGASVDKNKKSSPSFSISISKPL